MSASEYLRKLVEQHPELLKRGGIFRRSEVHESAEWLRIASLPRRELDFDATPDLTPLWKTPNGTMRLWPLQSAALLEAEKANGLFAILPVGSGKTLLAALLPDALQSQRTVILVPAQLKKRTPATWAELAKHFKLPLDRVTLVSYTELERVKTADVLERLQPDLIVADEAHLLKHKDSARTSRFLRYFKEHPDTRLAVMSGTLTQKSIQDYAHLIRLALKDRCPLPRDYMTLQEWSEALDVSEDPRPAGALNRLCALRTHAHSDHRSVFGCRLASSVGVVTAPMGFQGTSLRMRGVAFDPPEKVQVALERLRKSWVVADPETPEDAAEVIQDDLTYARFLRQLCLGFYLKWQWGPNGRDVEWLGARARWAGAVRHVLRYNRRPGLDSPLLVANAAMRGELATEHQDAWEAWAAVKERKQPPTVAVWIDRYAVERAAEWARTNAGIVWCEHAALCEEISKALGQSEDLSFDGRPQALSLHRFSTGVDGLQRVYRRCLYVSVPNEQVLEQSLGRLHREGQTVDVKADIWLPIPEYRTKLAGAFEEARYAQDTGFGQRKLLCATLEGIERE